MVKNTHGGNRHKSMARKSMGSNNSNRLRIAEEEEELYAVVTKHLGNNMFHCLCMDGNLRLGHIRGKFSGRRKGQNLVLPGVYVLIGIREWDNTTEKVVKGKVKLSECDLLEVYSKRDEDILKETIDIDWKQFDSALPSSGQSSNTYSDDVHFISEKDEERERLLKKMESISSSKMSLHIIEEQEEDIDIDSI
jgi:initiation factor 1A